MADFQSYHRPQGHSQAAPTGSRRLQRNIANQSTYATMQDWIRAFPRPRLNRVTKPRSAGNSPSAATRRRTTIGQGVGSGVSPQYHQSSLEAAYLASATQQSRPISWHPSSDRSQGLATPSWTPDYPSGNWTANGSMDHQMNGLPTDGVSAYSLFAGEDLQTGYFTTYGGYQENWPAQPPTSESMGWDGSSYYDYTTMNSSAFDPWAVDLLTPASNIPPAETACPSYASVPSPGEISGPSTPDFLPIQQFEDEPVLDKKPIGQPEEEELVGMGLYSQPGSAQNSLQQGVLGKGLKLEETFSPSEDGDEDADADAESDDDEDHPPSPQPQQSVPEPVSTSSRSAWAVPKQTSKHALNLLQKSFFFDHDESDQSPLTATQPFATHTQPCMTYGYSWI